VHHLGAIVHNQCITIHKIEKDILEKYMMELSKTKWTSGQRKKNEWMTYQGSFIMLNENKIDKDSKAHYSYLALISLPIALIVYCTNKNQSMNFQKKILK
jgi:hypothetical protein